MQWELITNIILISSIITVVVFAILGLYQWITRQSLKKVDPELLWMPLPLLLMLFVYLLFDKILPPITVRPNGSGEPGFPSTHAMVVCTVFFITTIILPRYIKNKTMRWILEIIMVILIALVSMGRVEANLHSPIDIIGGVLFAFVFSEIYYQVYKKQKKAKKKHVEHI